MENKVKGLKFKVQFYDDKGDTPYTIDLQSSGAGVFYGTDKRIKEMINEANAEFDRFSTDTEAFQQWVEAEINNMIDFHFRPGGLMSKISEQERPTRAQVDTWGWRIEEPKVTKRTYPGVSRRGLA